MRGPPAINELEVTFSMALTVGLRDGPLTRLRGEMYENAEGREGDQCQSMSLRPVPSPIYINKYVPAGPQQAK